ncbi:MAG TPA: methylmalonyl-CoA mutase family protein, partial [Solirubrobacteraceae bacterium]|nr:methylmalonyl-CoA mutase family protein [Solirubrobacteraceae bacterium]
LRTQQMLAHETGVTNTVDPLGGSYFVEALTDRMEQSAYEYFNKIDELGGMVDAVKLNYPQREIADAAFALQQEIDAGQRIVVGVNRFVAPDEQPIPTLRVDPALERKQLERLNAARARRDGGAVERTLAALREHAAHEDRILMEPLLDCARAGASEGEIVQSLQQVFGDYAETPVF